MNRIDLKIIECIRNGSNDQALSYLYDKPLKKIRKYILNNSGSTEDAHDIFQDAVVILFHQVKKNKYNPDYELDGFLFTVARNLWINRMIKEKRIVRNDLNQEHTSPDSNDHLKDLIVKEKSAALRKVFEKLDEKCRKLLYYVIFEELSMKEISERMGYSNENVVKNKHYRCKQYFSNLVKEDPVVLNLLKN